MLRSSDSSAYGVQDFTRDGVSIVSSFPQFFEGRFGSAGFGVVVLVVVVVRFVLVIQDRIRVYGQVLGFPNFLTLVEKCSFSSLGISPDLLVKVSGLAPALPGW